MKYLILILALFSCVEAKAPQESETIRIFQELLTYKLAGNNLGKLENELSATYVDKEMSMNNNRITLSKFFNSKSLQGFGVGFDYELSDTIIFLVTDSKDEYRRIGEIHAKFDNGKLNIVKIKIGDVELK